MKVKKLRFIVVCKTDSKILLTFGDQLRNVIVILACSIVLFSCTKEKDIPFQDSVKDTIDVVFYHNISGSYNGTISDIEFVSSSSYIVLKESKHSVEVSEIDFDNVFIEDISNSIESDVVASLTRINPTGGYLNFLPHSMADSSAPDSIFQNLYNGIYYYTNGNLDYFFHYIKQKDTVHQLFSGKLN